MNIIRIVIRLSLFLILVISFSCEKQDISITCSDCTAEEPLKTNLDVKLGYNGASTLIEVYEGNLEDSVLYKTYQTSDIKTTIPVILNKKYTLTATYYINGVYYIAVDSATPMVKYSKQQCDNPCYFVYDRTIDLRLKYTK